MLYSEYQKAIEKGNNMPYSKYLSATENDVTQPNSCLLHPVTKQPQGILTPTKQPYRQVPEALDQLENEIATLDELLQETCSRLEVACSKDNKATCDKDQEPITPSSQLADAIARHTRRVRGLNGILRSTLNRLEV